MEKFQDTSGTEGTDEQQQILVDAVAVVAGNGLAVAEVVVAAVAAAADYFGYFAEHYWIQPVSL